MLGYLSDPKISIQITDSAFTSNQMLMQSTELRKSCAPVVKQLRLQIKLSQLEIAVISLNKATNSSKSFRGATKQQKMCIQKRVEHLFPTVTVKTHTTLACRVSKKLRFFCQILFVSLWYPSSGKLNFIRVLD